MSFLNAQQNDEGEQRRAGMNGEIHLRDECVWFPSVFGETLNSAGEKMDYSLSDRKALMKLSPKMLVFFFRFCILLCITCRLLFLVARLQVGLIPIVLIVLLL